MPPPSTDPTTAPRAAPRAFPTVHGGCACGSSRYELRAPPLFCHACHCIDCAKSSGSVFQCFATVEAGCIGSIGKLAPQMTNAIGAWSVPKNAHSRGENTGTVPHADASAQRRTAVCSVCQTRLWAWGAGTPEGTADIFVGSLDLPELMQPDVHCFIRGKVSWITLPEGAKTRPRHYNYKEMWPASSLRRLEAIQARLRARAQAEAAARNAGPEGEEEKEDKTPTAQTPEERDEIEDDEAFEKRFRETEEALRARLEMLTLKLEGTDEVRGDDVRAGVAEGNAPSVGTSTTGVAEKEASKNLEKNDEPAAGRPVERN